MRRRLTHGLSALAIALCTLQRPALALSPVPTPAAPAQARTQYWCPMHPDVRSETRGVCPICGMKLVAMPPVRFGSYPVDLRATPTVSGVRLRLAVTNPSTHAIVRRFETVHERTMHVFVVSEGLDFFAHEHAVLQRDGVFMLDLSLPQRGAYMAIAEFLPVGGTPQTFQQTFTTGESFARRPAPTPDAAPKTVDGMRISIDPSSLKSGEIGKLTFRVEDAASAAPVTDLEPYLGASAHLLIVPVDLTEAIHGHPTADEKGPVLAFAPLIPRNGRYKLWLQIQRRGIVSTAPFVIDVPANQEVLRF
jgi:hypothetical protein